MNTDSIYAPFGLACSYPGSVIYRTSHSVDQCGIYSAVVQKRTPEQEIEEIHYFNQRYEPFEEKKKTLVSVLTPTGAKAVLK